MNELLVRFALLVVTVPLSSIQGANDQISSKEYGKPHQHPKSGFFVGLGIW